MKLLLHRADDFNADFRQRYSWYLEQEDEVLAEHFLQAVGTTLQKLLTQPTLGSRRKFRNPLLTGLRSFRVEPPFNC